jgi:hypothetical protein
MDNLHSVSDEKHFNKTIGTANRNRGYEVYGSGKSTREQHIDQAFDKVREELLDDLFEAETRSDVEDLLTASLWYTIEHYKLNIEPDDVLPFFWKNYGLKD